MAKVNPILKSAAVNTAGYGAGYVAGKYYSPESKRGETIGGPSPKHILGVGAASAYLGLTPAGQRKSVSRTMRGATMGVAMASGYSAGHNSRFYYTRVVNGKKQRVRKGRRK